MKRPAKKAATDRSFVVALSRGLEVLRAFRPNDGLLGNQEIAARTNLPKPTVSRLTYTLTKLGYLTQVPRFEKYQLAPAAMSLGYAALANLGVQHLSESFREEVMRATGGAVAVGARDRLSMGWQPNYQDEARIYAKYLLKEKPDAKVAVLYQNDDFGKDYVKGFKEGLGDKAKSMSPMKMFKSCGSSSIAVARSHRPTRVTRGSSSDAWTGPKRSASGTIDRNFKALNDWPPRPIRVCGKNIGPPSVHFTARAMMPQSGADATSPVPDNAISKDRLIMN